jgi:two-component system sensor histidine kinase VicK
MEKLVQDLLTLSKYDRKTEIKFTTFDIGKLTKSCVEKFEIEVQRKGQKLNSYVTSNIPDIEGDYDGLERVIINIISNSVKYTPECGSIDVYVGSFRNIAYIKIKDTGIGISRKDLDRVFDRFYRVDKARSREMGGTGLGLSIAKQIVEQNGGNIEIKSEPGKGTEVIIQVPIKNEKEQN